MTRLDELHQLRRSLDLEIAREEAALTRMGILRDEFHDVLATAPSDVAQVVLAVAEAYSVASADITGRSRDRDATAARQIACWLLHVDGVTYSEIGRLLGRDHSTVMSSVRRVEASPRLSDTAYRLRDHLNQKQTHLTTVRSAS